MLSDLKLILQNPSSEPPEQYLRFTLKPEVQVMLPLNQISEILALTLAQIVPIPGMSPWIIGVYNWRGEILWIVDLGDLVGLMPWSQYASTTVNYRVIILRSVDTKGENIFLGLVVPQVEDIELCAPSEIYSPPSSAVIPGMSRFLRGYWLKAEGTIVMILDGRAILAAMPQ